MSAPEADRDLAPYLDHLRELPFVRHIEVAQDPALEPFPGHALIKLRTRRRVFRLALETKRTFLDQALTNAVIAKHRETLRRHRIPVLLAARYIPRPTGERLAEAGVNFVDRPGNIHVKLGDDYHVLLLGRRDPAREPTARRPGPALVQLLFLLLAEPTAADWPIRKLAHAAGTGKTAAANAVQRLVRLRILGKTADGALHVIDRRRLADDYLTGYQQVLRPHLFVGRFTPPQRDPDGVLQEIARVAKHVNMEWAVAGGPGAYALERFYRGEDIPVFVAPIAPAFQRSLKWVPDRNGPVTLLRGFGQRWVWRGVDGVQIAHPWLIYVELLLAGEPRALEAAEQIRETYLKP